MGSKRKKRDRRGGVSDFFLDEAEVDEDTEEDEDEGEGDDLIGIAIAMIVFNSSDCLWFRCQRRE